MLVERVIVGVVVLSNALFAQDCDRRSLDARSIGVSLKPNVSAKICNRSPHDFYNNVDECSYESRLGNALDCSVIARNSSEDCGTRNFHEGTVCRDPGACGVYVNIILLEHTSIPTAVTKINIASELANLASLRYSVYPQNLRENELYDRCIDFTLRKTASREHPVFYDCNMQRIENIGTRALLYYVVDQQYGQILLKIPNGSDLANRSLVPFYIHVVSNDDGTLSLRRSKMTVTFQAYLDAALAGAPQPLYRVTLYQKQCGNCGWVVNAVAIANVSDPSSYIDRWKNLYTVEVGSSLGSGMYNVTVLPVCKENGPALFNYSYSLEFSITVRTMPAAGIMGLCLGFAILVFGLCQLAYLAYMLRLFIRRRTTIRSLEKKTLYIIYKDISQEHTTRVSALRQFLIQHMNLTVWMDRHDMIHRKELDPHSWSAKCVGEADYVAVVVPPLVTDDNNYKPLYPLNFAMGCQQLDMRLRCLLSAKKTAAGKLCAIISLSGSSQLSHLPQELRLYNRFELPTEGTKFEYYIWHEELKMTQLDWCFRLGLVTWCTGKSDADYRQQFESIVTELQRRPASAITLVKDPKRDPPAGETSEDESERTEDDMGFSFYEGNEDDSESSEYDPKEEFVIGGHLIRHPALFVNCDSTSIPML